MNKSVLLRCVVLMSLNWFFASTVYAKGVFEWVVIADQRTGAEIQLSPQDSQKLAQFLIFDFMLGPLETVPLVGEGYTIKRGYLNNEQFSPFDLVVYYPGVGSDRGYIHYLGLLGADGEEVGGWSEYDNHWYYIDQAAEKELRIFLNTDPEPAPNLSTWQNGLSISLRVFQDNYDHQTQPASPARH